MGELTARPLQGVVGQRHDSATAGPAQCGAPADAPVEERAACHHSVSC